MRVWIRDLYIIENWKKKKTFLPHERHDSGASSGVVNRKFTREFRRRAAETLPPPHKKASEKA